jgi:hypothetical protein
MGRANIMRMSSECSLQMIEMCMHQDDANLTMYGKVVENIKLLAHNGNYKIIKIKIILLTISNHIIYATIL